MVQENRSIPASISNKDWEETPASVRELAFSLIERMEKLEEKTHDLVEACDAAHWGKPTPSLIP